MLVQVEFLGSFKNGFKWNSKIDLYLGDGIVDIVGATKKSLHIVPEGGTMKDRISVPKDKIKIIKVIK